MRLIGFYSVVCQITLAACVGCNGRGTTVQGTVTIEGQLARQGTVQFHPVGDGPTAYGIISDNGSYALRVGQGDLTDPNAGEVPLGEYVVTVMVNSPSVKDATVGDAHPPLPGARLTAEKYANEDTSDLRVTVIAGPNIVPLELEGEDVGDSSSAAAENGRVIEHSSPEASTVEEGSGTSDSRGETTTDEPTDGPQGSNVEEQLQ